MEPYELILVTGGAGFIGSTLVKQLLRETSCRVVNVDKLTYAGNLDSLASVSNSTRYHFERLDIADGREMRKVFRQYQPDAVMHLAAESHVDRSIDEPADFIQTNIVGTSVLLEVVREYLRNTTPAKRKIFRFHQISTDEVYGSLGADGYFTESSPYRPNSPYAASKAAADHLVRSWHETYELPVIITNCGNNYGPFQFPEKLVPLMILAALDGKPLPIYGDGRNVRDWIYVEDHCQALRSALTSGVIGETYLIGAGTECTNVQLVEQLCRLLDQSHPHASGKSYREQMTFVDDRRGHDRRYALDANKIRGKLGWAPKESFESGLRKTVSWYVENADWCRRATKGRYDGERLGLRV